MIKDLKIRNFRDIHGYQNKYGEAIKPCKIFRGAALDKISIEDAKYMEEELGIAYILDYRDEQESLLARDIDFPHAVYERIGALQSNHQDHQGFDFGAMMQGEMTVEKLQFLIEYIREGYRLMAFNNPAYHRLFELLLRGDGNVYFHCSAGKDRTGVSAFLIMIALGMSEEEGISEYLLSNQYLKPYNEQLMIQLNIPQEMQKHCEPLLYVQKENILLTISSIKQNYQNYDDFLLKEYGIDEEKKHKLRELYCIGDDEFGI